MGQEIHARRCDDAGDKKNWRYRIWSTVTDSYHTPEMDEPQLLRWLVEEDVQNSLRRVSCEFAKRLERAHERGTSAYHTSAQSTTGPWQESVSDEEPQLCLANAADYIGGPDGFAIVLLAQDWPYKREPLPRSSWRWRCEVILAGEVIGERCFRVKIQIEEIDPSEAAQPEEEEEG